MQRAPHGAGGWLNVNLTKASLSWASIRPDERHDNDRIDRAPSKPEAWGEALINPDTDFEVLEDRYCKN